MRLNPFSSPHLSPLALRIINKIKASVHKIFGSTISNIIKKYIKHDYEIIISIPSKVKYPIDGYESNINYKIDCFHEMRTFFNNYLKKSEKNKSNLLNAGSGIGSLDGYVFKDSINESKIEKNNFFDHFNYWTLEYFDLDIERIINNGKGEIYFSDTKSFRDMDINKFKGYPKGFHTGHIKADLTSDDIQESYKDYKAHFDVIICINVLEHVMQPFKCAENLDYLLKDHGEIIIVVPFCQAYHEDPSDYQRFTHAGVLNLFQQIDNSNYKVEKWGYDITDRRDNRGSYKRDGAITVPNDSFGGWREYWMTYCHIKKDLNKTS